MARYVLVAVVQRRTPCLFRPIQEALVDLIMMDLNLTMMDLIMMDLILRVRRRKAACHGRGPGPGGVTPLLGGT